jgi:hypothetical protein
MIAVIIETEVALALSDIGILLPEFPGEILNPSDGFVALSLNANKSHGYGRGWA